jgi:urease accessory protein
VVINKIDLAPYVEADLDLIHREATERRRGKPIAYTNCKTGEGLDQVMQFIFDKLLFQSVRVLAQ